MLWWIFLDRVCWPPFFAPFISCWWPYVATCKVFSNSLFSFEYPHFPLIHVHAWVNSHQSACCLLRLPVNRIVCQHVKSDGIVVSGFYPPFLHHRSMSQNEGYIFGSQRGTWRNPWDKNCAGESEGREEPVQKRKWQGGHQKKSRSHCPHWKKHIIMFLD